MKNLSILAVIVALAVVFAGCQVTPPTPPSDDTQMEQSSVENKEKDVSVAVEVVDENANSDDVSEPENEVAMEKSGDAAKYVEYSAAQYDEFRGSKSFVVFFHADWCPTCKRMEKEILADLENYPEGTVFMKTDYDKEKDLKRELNIVVQSTVVVFNAEGNEVYRATDPALDDLKAAIERSLQVS